MPSLRFWPVFVAALCAGCSCRSSLRSLRRAVDGLRAHRTDPRVSFAGTRIPPREIVRQRYLLIGDRLPELQRRARGNWPAWQTLLAWANEHARDPEAEAAENLALAYRVGGDRALARAALVAVHKLMKRDVRDDSYLYFGDEMRGVSVVLDWCADALSDADGKALADYLDRWTNELWFDNKGSGWGLDDPGNNYHMAFLEGTAHAGFALYKRGNPRAERYLQVLFSKLEGPSGVLAYLNTRGSGGDWNEGANYGQRAKQRLTSALLAIASMGGPNEAAATPFFRDSVSFALYQLQPDRVSIDPAGDLARDSAMTVSPFDRDVLQASAFLVSDDDARAHARWFLAKVVPSYGEGVFRWPEAYYKDVLFDVAGPAVGPEKLARSYYALGNRSLFVRSDWTQDATELNVSGSSVVDQSHAHVDVGSFTLFKGGWQAADASTYSKSGMCWQAGAHNMIDLMGHERRDATLGGITAFSEHDGVAYARIDASGLFRQHRRGRDILLTKEWTRELVFLEPNTLVIYDRVEPNGALPYDWRLHFAEQPQRDGSRSLHASHERGAIAVQLLIGGEPLIRRDDDLDGGPSEAWRMQAPPAPGADAGRFLAVVRVGLGSAPALTAVRIDGGGALDGAVVDGTAVVFSRAPFGKSAGSASYGFSGPVRRHVVVDVEGETDLRVSDGRAEISAGSRYRPDSAGMIIAAP